MGSRRPTLARQCDRRRELHLAGKRGKRAVSHRFRVLRSFRKRSRRKRQAPEQGKAFPSKSLYSNVALDIHSDPFWANAYSGASGGGYGAYQTSRNQ